MPIPEPIRRVGKRVYPFPDMEVGDSFRAPVEMRGKLESAAYAYGKKSGKKFIIRRSAEHVHVFRIE